MDKCKAAKNTMANISANEVIKRERAESNVRFFFSGHENPDRGLELLNNFTVKASKYFDKNQVLNPYEVDDILAKLYGDKPSRDNIVTKILAIIHSTAAIKEMGVIQAYLKTHPPKGMVVATEKGSHDLYAYPLSTLNNVLALVLEAKATITDLDKSEALFGDFYGQLLTPTTLAKRSPGLNIIHEAIRDYVGDTGYDTNQFMETEHIRKINSKINRGMKDILSSIKNLFPESEVGIKYDDPGLMSVPEKSMFIFSRYMLGQIKYQNMSFKILYH